MIYSSIVPVAGALATSKMVGDYFPIYSFDTSKSLAGNDLFIANVPISYGSAVGNQWLSQFVPVKSNWPIKLNVDLGRTYEVRRIYYENSHDSGGTTEVGFNAVDIYGTNDESAYREVRGYILDNLTLLWSGNFIRHVTSSNNTLPFYSGNIPDPQYITLTNYGLYRYYSFVVKSIFFNPNTSYSPYTGIRRIELQEALESSSSSSTSTSSSSSSSTEFMSSSSSSSTSSNSSSLSSSSSSYKCPNNISILTGVDIYTSGIITSNIFLSVNTNGSTDGSYYLELFDGDTSGKTYDLSRVFYGHEGSNTITSSNFVSILIDGITYYLEVFGGDIQTDCCSNLAGTYYTTGSFQSAGYIMVNCNGNLKFVQVYVKTL